MGQAMSNQKKIWDHFQSVGINSFSLNQGRLEYLAKQLRPGTNVLNIGVGNGVLERLAVGKNVDIWSLDPSELAIERLRSTLGMAEKAQVGYCQTMPFSNEQFDVVVMSEVLEHLDETVFFKTLAEVHRVLRSGGRFIGTVPARERLEDAQVVCPHCGEKFHRWGHIQAFDVGTLTEALRSNFKVDRIFEHFFIDWAAVGLIRKLQGLLKKLLSWRGIGTYGTCRNIFFEAIKK